MQVFRKVSSIFAIAVGIAMVGIWLMLFFTGQVPELVTDPLIIAFHLIAELVAAFFLIAGGVMLFWRHPLGEKVYLVSLGMLLYTVINSSGYYAQRGDWSFVTMFAILFVLASYFLAGLLSGSTRE